MRRERERERREEKGLNSIILRRPRPDPKPNTVNRALGREEEIKEREPAVKKPSQNNAAYVRSVYSKSSNNTALIYVSYRGWS